MASTTSVKNTIVATSADPSQEGQCVFTQRYADLKKRIIKKEDEEAVIKAWNEILEELSKATDEFIKRGTELIPQVEFSELSKLSDATIGEIRKRGALLVKNVVSDEEALLWKEQLREYVKANPSVVGVPEENKQFFEVYWSKSQLQARSHPNVLATSKFLNLLYHNAGPLSSPVSLSTPLTIVDRFRIRLPSEEKWSRHTPHVDSGSIERWEDDVFRSAYESILKGSWRSYDPFSLEGRLTANTNIYGRSNQTTVFKAWQGWLAMSDTGPHEGTLQVFPDLLLGTSYITLRPFFRMVDPASPTPLDPSNWVLDLDKPDFPGIPTGKLFGPIKPSKESHPHMRVEEAMVSVPKVAPGDMIFWHGDTVHSVEPEHLGKNDSSVMYIPAVPLTVPNIKYVVRQRDHFYRGLAGPDFPQGVGEVNFVKKGEIGDIHAAGRAAMGLEKFDETESVDDVLGSKEAIKFANELIASSL